jgi:hypothetical protein
MFPVEGAAPGVESVPVGERDRCVVAHIDLAEQRWLRVADVVVGSSATVAAAIELADLLFSAHPGCAVVEIVLPGGRSLLGHRDSLRIVVPTTGAPGEAGVVAHGGRLIPASALPLVPDPPARDRTVRWRAGRS